MNIALYNLEPKYINFALEKIRMYHKSMGDIVTDYFPLKHSFYNKIYASSIFTFTDKSGVTDDMIKGGSGFNIYNNLPEYIETMKPKINFGTTTRGCFRKCEFCIVPKKEGSFKIVCDLYDIWDGKSKSVVLFDNNILIDKNHFKKICLQALNEKINVEFNQGLDIRLIDEECLKLYKKVKIKNMIFAFDNIAIKNLIIEKLDMLKSLRLINQSMFYCYCNKDNIFDCLERLNILKIRGCSGYVMQDPLKKSKQTIALARWANQKICYRSYSFSEFIKAYRYTKYFDQNKIRSANKYYCEDHNWYKDDYCPYCDFNNQVGEV